MKSKYWIAVIGGLLALCIGLSVWLMLPRESATKARILSNGAVIVTIDLSWEGEWTVTSPDGGVNVVTVKDGKIAVTSATCPDHHCMNRGFCDSGTAIVCLPNRLVIEFVTEQDVDGVVG